MKKSNLKVNRTKLYHKLINNKLMYDNKSVNNYKKDINKNLMINPECDLTLNTLSSSKIRY